MNIKRACLLLVIAASLISLTGCPPKKKPVLDYNKQLPPGQLALVKITDPNQIPDFTAACADTANLRESIRHSLNYLAKPSSKAFFPYGEVTHDQAKQTLMAMEQMLDSGLSPDQMNQKIRTEYDCYISRGCDELGTVLYTGYYTPIFSGSTVKTDVFKYPLYKQPDDLVKGPNGEILGQKGPDGQIHKYPDRRTIESSNMLAGKELVYLADPFEVYIAHVQGSAKIRLPDGSLQTYGYAANNGWEYQSVGKTLIGQGKLTQEQLNLKALIDYFHNHPAEVAPYIEQNPRFVFFQLQSGEPRGSLNEPVTPFRTIATDKTIYPRACMAFVKADLARPVGWVLDQDTGGAIRAAGRCDVYMGVGDQAAELAGGTYKEGKLYYIFVKPGTGPSLSPASPPFAPTSNAPASGGSIQEAQVPRTTK